MRVRIRGTLGMQTLPNTTQDYTGLGCRVSSHVSHQIPTLVGFVITDFVP